MASIYYIINDASTIRKEISERSALFLQLQKIDYHAAVLIQKTWRGYAARMYIRRLNAAATCIQRWYRGWILRWKLISTLRERYIEVGKMWYGLKAARIQAAWKGYCTRKLINVKKIIRNREKLRRINEYVGCMMESENRRWSNYKHRNEYQLDCYKDIVSSLFEKHYLLRSYGRPGVLSKPNTHELSDVEMVLKNMKFKEYNKNIRKLKKGLKEESIENEGFIDISKEDQEL